MKVSMDSRGRAKGNRWIEKFWEKIKYEYIYIVTEENGTALCSGIKRFIDNYNYHRKLSAVYNSTSIINYVQKKDIAEHIEMLGNAMRGKKVVILKGYESSHSGEVCDRLIEPFEEPSRRLTSFLTLLNRISHSSKRHIEIYE